MMTFLIVTALALIALGIWVYSYNKRVQFEENKKFVKHHELVSECRRVRIRVKDAVVVSITVDGKRYKDIDDVFSQVALSKKTHNELFEIKKQLARYREDVAQDMVVPKSYQEFTDTSIGDIRVYRPSTVRVNDRFAVIIEQDLDHNLYISEVLISKHHLNTDKSWTSFSLVDEELKENRPELNALYREFLMHPEYDGELREFEGIVEDLSNYNGYKDSFDIVSGQLVVKGSVLVQIPKKEEDIISLPEGKALRNINKLLAEAVPHK